MKGGDEALTDSMYLVGSRAFVAVMACEGSEGAPAGELQGLVPCQCGKDWAHGGWEEQVLDSGVRRLRVCVQEVG